MIGAIIGDLAGSVYEFEQTKGVHPVQMEKVIPENAFFTDDSILTIAVLDALVEGRSYEESLKQYISQYQDYHPDFSPTFSSPFSPGLIQWSEGKKAGNSRGNGAMMRISPVGFLVHGEKEVIRQAKLATTPSHNHPESIWAATTIAMMIYYFRCGYSKKDVYRKLNLPIHYEPFTKFNTTCLETIDNCLYAFYTSSDFRDAICKTLLMGGDTDTNCAIVGSLAEAYYGLEDSLKREALEKVPEGFQKVLKKTY